MGNPLVLCAMLVVADPSPKPPEVTVADTVMVVDGVEFSDSMPPGCGELRPGCSKEAPGYDILVVWLKPKSPLPEGQSDWDQPFFDALMDFRKDDVFVVSGAGEKTKKSSGGSTGRTRYFIAFTPKEGGKDFVLHYGKQGPIPLGK